MKLVLVIAVLCSAVAARSLVKRDNSYGDEQIAPLPEASADAGYAAPEEQAPAVAEQPIEEYQAPAVEESGYRKKRDNSYGDEPEQPISDPMPEEYQAPAEEAPAAAEQPVEEQMPAVEASGYRKKRDNSYGDEPEQPISDPMPEEYQAPAEEAPAAAEQPVEENQAPAVEASGYRKKRDNSYGDEPEQPISDPMPEEYQAPAEEAPAAAEQPVEEYQAPAVEASGYRKKRDNSYGDEPEQPISDPMPEEYQAPAEEAPAAAEQPVEEYQAPAVEASGYRKKRDNSYGDEPEQPISDPMPEEYQAPAEEAPAAAEQPVEEYQAPAVEASGYRKKRDNSYGDEPEQPISDPMPEEYQAPAEEAPAAAEQPVEENQAPAVEASGYRKKRDNSYGDEPEQPISDPMPEEYQAPAEEAPAAAEQPVEEYQAPAVEASGYRKKRDNSYGDEPEQPISDPMPEEYQAPAEEAPAAAEQPVEENQAPAVEASGYRKKRDNSYGDEPEQPISDPMPEEYQAPAEEAPAAAADDIAIDVGAEVEASGYRK